MTLVYLACAWLLGIYLGPLIHLPTPTLGAAVAACGAASFLLRERPRERLLSTLLLVLFLGLWRYDWARPRLTPGPLAAYNDGEAVTFRGVVINDPLPRDRWTNLQVIVHDLSTNGAWMPSDGQVLVQVPSYASYYYGDELQVRGKLETPADFDGFSYRTYLARQGIHSQLRHAQITVLARDRGQRIPAALYALKRRTQDVITSILPEPEAALLTGILVGSDQGIPQSLLGQFRATGTAHIIAISGFNITLISAALLRLFSRVLQRYVALIMAVAAIGLYTVLVGAEPPVVRAAIMGGLSALALIVGRREHTLTSLFAAAWLMTAWQPFTLWEIGFQLSFAASLGLILYLGKLGVAFEDALGRFVSLETAQRVAAMLREGLLATLAALLTTLPLMVYHFGHFSPLTLIANLLVLPVQPTVMYLGSTAAMAGLLFLPLGRMLGWSAWIFLTYTVRTVEVLADWTRNDTTGSRIHPAMLVAYYGLLALLTVNPPSKPLWAKAVKRLLSKGAVRKAIVAALVILSVLVWAAVASLPDGRLHVAFLDVGQGDAILVQTPAGNRLLIDGGPSPAALLAALGRRLPFWDRRIDLVMLTHPHEDHLRGLLPLLERYQVRQALLSEAQHGSGVYEEWQKLLQEEGIPSLVVQQPMQVDFGDGPTMEVLPTSDGDSGGLDETWLVARLVWQRASFLFTGDLEADGLLQLRYTGWPLSCTVLKVPHHGSDEALNEELLATTAPDLAVISVGADNRFGHPGPQTLECLEDAGIGILRTDQVGTVEVATDGERYWVQTRGAQ